MFLFLTHKLVGCHNSFSGISLAKELKNNRGFNQHIMFLSRTSQLDKKVMEELEGLDSKEYDWISKGYAGKDILQKDYFKEKVIKIIEDKFREINENTSLILAQEIYSMLDDI